MDRLMRMDKLGMVISVKGEGNEKVNDNNGRW